MPHTNIERNRLYDRAAQKRRATNKYLMEVDTPTEEMREVIRKSMASEAPSEVVSTSPSKDSLSPEMIMLLLIFGAVIILVGMSL